MLFSNTSYLIVDIDSIVTSKSVVNSMDQRGNELLFDVQYGTCVRHCLFLPGFPARDFLSLNDIQQVKTYQGHCYTIVHQDTFYFYHTIFTKAVKPDIYN